MEVEEVGFAANLCEAIKKTLLQLSKTNALMKQNIIELILKFISCVMERIKEKVIALMRKNKSYQSHIHLNIIIAGRVNIEAKHSR